MAARSSPSTRSTGPSRRLRPAANLRGRSSRRALEGVRVVSLAQNVPGPVAVARLVAEGASAVKIEPPGGDPLEGFCRGWYGDLHRGVRVLRVDLKTAAGRQRLNTLLEPADLLVTSQRPSALDRLGLDPVTLADAYPRLAVIQIVGDVASPETPGHDLTYQARAGLLGAEMPRTLLADLLGAERVVSTALLLLRQKKRGAVLLGLEQCLDALTAPLLHGLTSPRGRLGGGLPAYRIYAAREGRVAVAALEPHFRLGLYKALGVPEGQDLEAVMRTRTALQWERWARPYGLPIAAIRRAPSAARGSKRLNRGTPRTPRARR